MSYYDKLTPDRELPHRVVAEIVCRPDHGPVRLERNGRLKKPMGLYFSVKAGRHLPWESRNELHAFWWAEVRSDVIESWAQPHTLKMIMDGARCGYTPDREDALVGGRAEIVEVKDRFEADKDPAYTRKLEQARAIYEAFDFTYRVVTREEIEAQPAFSAVSYIQRFRGAAIADGDRDRAWAALDRGPVALARLVEALAPNPAALPVICAMIVHRVLAIDPWDGFTPESPVSLVDHAAPGRSAGRIQVGR